MAPTSVTALVSLAEATAPVLIPPAKAMPLLASAVATLRQTAAPIR
jgi:hypothetical protein